MTPTDLALLDNLRRRGGVTFAHVSPQYREKLRRWAAMTPPLVVIADNRATVTLDGITFLQTKGAKP